MKIKHVLPALALTFAAAAPSAFADQFAWVDEDQAQAAVKRLSVGSIVGEWVSHMGGSPSMFIVRDARVIDEGDHFEVQVTAEPLAELTPAGEYADAQFDVELLPAGDRVEKRLDLAYVFVPSREILGMQINLAKALNLRSDYFPDGARVGQIAFEIPVGLIDEAGDRGIPLHGQGSSTGQADGIADAVQGEADDADAQTLPAEQAETGQADADADAGAELPATGQADDADAQTLPAEQAETGQADADADADAGAELPATGQADDADAQSDAADAADEQQGLPLPQQSQR